MPTYNHKIKDMSTNNNRFTLLIIAFSFKSPENIINILREAKFNTQIANTSEEVFDMSETSTPDLIILNIEKPEQEICNIIQKLKKNRHTRDIPILFIAPITEHTHFPDYLLLDNIDFIRDSFYAKELILRIQHQLSSIKTKNTLQQQNQKLQEIIESRDKLYSIIAHDLRAPISTIKMINSTLASKKELISNPQIEKLFEMINETTEEAFNLLENLLRWSRNQHDKPHIYPATFNITASIQQVVSLFTTIASTKGISLNNHSKEEVYVYADEDMIKTVLRNLISNAVKFSFPQGHIDICIDQTPHVVKISVQDNGQGIKKELQSKLLKTNKDITTYGTYNEKGSGLGLVLCRDFIKMNKGKLWFTSQEKQGTIFHFTVPKHPSVSAFSESS